MLASQILSLIFFNLMLMKFLIISISLLSLSFPIFASDGLTLHLDSPDNNETGILFLRRIKGELVWMDKGNEKKHWKYKGEIKNGKPNGTGVLNSSYGEYVGELKNGMLHGQGTYTYKSGRIKVGEFKEGKPWNVKNYNNDGIIEEEWVDGKNIKREKIEGGQDKDLSDFENNFRVRALLGKTSGESTSSNNSLLLIWKNYGLGLNQMSFNNTSSKNILYEMNSSSLDLSYTLFVKDYTITSGIAYVYDGKGDITVESSKAKYSTEDVFGYGIFGIFGMQWFGIEALIGFRYSGIDYKEFQGTNTTELLTHGTSHFTLEKKYSISGSSFLLGIGYNF